MKTITSPIIALLLVIVLFTRCNRSHKVHILPYDEIFTCKNHVHVIDDHPAKCPLDGTDLIKKKITEEQRKMIEDNNFERAKE